jgi:hypothetical protein
MKFLYQKFDATKGQKVKVDFSKPTKVKMMNTVHFEKYRKSKTHTYVGGAFEKSPAVFEVPSDGRWVVVIEKGTHFKPLDLEGSVELHPVDSSLEVTRALDAPEPKKIQHKEEDVVIPTDVESNDNEDAVDIQTEQE